ncbi:MAG: DUF305 domain-containing protein [Nocardioidaceae bacterium]
MAALATALVGGGVTYAVADVADPAVSSSPSMGSMGSITAGQPFDAQFLDQMIVHHEGAIMSTRAMIADSSRPELRGLAEDILTSQREQITQMRAWRAEWYPELESTFDMGGSMMGGSMMGGSMMGGSMMGGDSGTERMYLQMMIVHHQLGVDMAEQAQAEAVHPKLKELAEVIAKEQAAQIEQMRGYLAASPE